MDDVETTVAALYDQHADSLFALAFRLTNDRGRAEDIVQEAIVRAWRHPEALDGGSGGSARAWLNTVVKNLATDGWRAASVRPRTVNDPRAVTEAAAFDDIDRAVEAWKLADALRRLSAAHQEVLVHLYYSGRSVAETAQQIGIPPGTVKSRSFYALRALRLVFEETGLLP